MENKPKKDECEHRWKYPHCGLCHYKPKKKVVKKKLSIRVK